MDKGVELLDDLITSELVLYTDKEPPYFSKTYSMSYSGSPLSITQAQKRAYAFRVVKNRTGATLYRFCLMKNCKRGVSVVREAPLYESQTSSRATRL